MEFDMIGVDAAIANAFRRILIAEVGVCISDVRLILHTSLDNILYWTGFPLSPSLPPSLPPFSLVYRFQPWQLRRCLFTTILPSSRMRYVSPSQFCWMGNPSPPLQVLAHRLGLIPIRADPRHFKMLSPCMLEASVLTTHKID